VISHRVLAALALVACSAVRGRRSSVDQEDSVRTMFDARWRLDLLGRLRRLRPDAPARWGRMSAPQMIAHLSDQMRHTLGDVTPAPRPGPLRWPLVRQAVIHWLPWPRGRIQGPPEAFVTRPTTWGADLATLEALVERFAVRGPGGAWPDHALFGRMRGRDWGVFCYKHFDHHLRQFGEGTP
jgi:hypothetical protein